MRSLKLTFSVIVLFTGVCLVTCAPAIPHNPCPNVFHYHRHRSNGTVFGRIRVPYDGSNILLLQLNASIAGDRSEDDYQKGSRIPYYPKQPGYNREQQLRKKQVNLDIELKTKPLDIINNKAKDIYYDVSFPEQKTIPTITKIKLNGRVLCSNRGDPPVQDKSLVINLWAEHKISFNANLLKPPKRPGGTRPQRPGVETPQRPNVVMPQRPDVETPQKSDGEKPQKSEAVVTQRPGVVTPQHPDVVMPQRPGTERPQRPGVVMPPRPGAIRLPRPDVGMPQRPNALRPPGPGVVWPHRPSVVMPQPPGVVMPQRPGTTIQYLPGVVPDQTEWISGDSTEWIFGESGEWIPDDTAEWIPGDYTDWISGDWADWTFGDSVQWISDDTAEWIPEEPAQWVYSESSVTSYPIYINMEPFDEDY